MNLNIFKDYSLQSRATADLIVDYISAKPQSLVCLASGHTPRGVFEFLVDDVMAKRVDIGKCIFVSLDEWLGIPANQKGSCRAMVDDDFFTPLRIPDKQIAFFDGMANDPAAEADRINKLIKDHGGLDIMLVGVGTNGHIAMNEPGTSFDIMAHVSTLAEETKSVGQKYFTENTVLEKGITLGLGQFRQTKLPILMANGTKKAPIMEKIMGSNATESLPGSIVHIMDHAWVMLDEACYTKARHLS
ncbi:MAG TPA: glucosamine-6-phosphate deaminase [Chryseolinea sp.]|nr:glucosamine-6-phosphate deaminase [Chryseolinea sp.]